MKTNSFSVTPMPPEGALDTFKRQFPVVFASGKCDLTYIVSLVLNAYTPVRYIGDEVYEGLEFFGGGTKILDGIVPNTMRCYTVNNITFTIPSKHYIDHHDDYFRVFVYPNNRPISDQETTFELPVEVFNDFESLLISLSNVRETWVCATWFNYDSAPSSTHYFTSEEAATAYGKGCTSLDEDGIVAADNYSVYMLCIEYTA